MQILSKAYLEELVKINGLDFDYTTYLSAVKVWDTDGEKYIDVIYERGGQLYFYRATNPFDAMNRNTSDEPLNYADFDNMANINLFQFMNDYEALVLATPNFFTNMDDGVVNDMGNVFKKLAQWNERIAKTSFSLYPGTGLPGPPGVQGPQGIAGPMWAGRPARPRVNRPAPPVWQARKAIKAIKAIKETKEFRDRIVKLR